MHLRPHARWETHAGSPRRSPLRGLRAAPRQTPDCSAIGRPTDPRAAVRTPRRRARPVLARRTAPAACTLPPPPSRTAPAPAPPHPSSLVPPRDQFARATSLWFTGAASARLAAVARALEEGERLPLVLGNAASIVEQLAGQKASARVSAPAGEASGIERGHEQDHRVRRVARHAMSSQVEPREVIASRTVVRVARAAVEAGRYLRVAPLATVELEENACRVARLRVALALRHARGCIAVAARVLRELVGIGPRVHVRGQTAFGGVPELGASPQENHYGGPRAHISNVAPLAPDRHFRPHIGGC